MAKIFLTVVGTSDYEPTEYRLGTDSMTNRFVQKALLTMLSNRGETFDKIVFFLTEGAKAKNWELYTGKRKLEDNTFELIKDEGLKTFLESNYPGIYKLVSIKYGENEKEIFELFNAMYDAIDENDEITFDITQGFRFIPFLFFPLISYAKELKNVKIKNIYYGLFSRSKPSEIIDLQPYDEILDCANAAHNFIRSGNAKEISDIINAHNIKIPKEQKINFSPVKKVSSAISDLTDALLTCQGGKNENSINSLTDKLYNMKESLNNSATYAASLFNNLIIKAVDSVSSLHDARTPYEQSIEAVKWYTDRNLFLQAFTALRETITTFFCCIYAPEQEYVDEKFRQEVIDRAVTSFNYKHGSQPSDQNRMREASELRSKPGYAAVFIKIIRHVDPDKLRFIASIVEVRNHMNHFGMKTNKKIIKKKNLEKYIRSVEELIADVESRRDEIISTENALELLDGFCSGKNGVFVNFSNHPAKTWNDDQLNAAKEMCSGEIIDVPFPNVSSNSSETEIALLAEEYAEKIISLDPSAVMCMGEFGVCFNVVRQLKKNHIKTVYSCTERHADEVTTDEGTEKKALFRFVKFREY